MIGNSIDNNELAAMTREAAPRVISAIKAAATRTGVNFAYLMEQAAAESGFNPKAGTKTSSAKGLYQFIESTWLRMVRDHGAKHGLGKYAEMIGDNGKVSSPQARREILALRNDPDKAAVMAAELAADNREYLEKYSGLKPGEIGATELYLAHFLGAGGAAAFLKGQKDNPLANAADLFPQAARANRNVFYDARTGQGRTLAGVYDFFAKKFSISNGEDVRVAAKKTTPLEPERSPARIDIERTQILVMAQEAASAERTFAFLRPQNNPRSPEDAFDNLFRAARTGRDMSQAMIMARLYRPEYQS